jgi:hypothetical protein
MTKREIAKWIVANSSCYVGHRKKRHISCNGRKDGINAGTPCPCLEGEFDCDGYDNPAQAAQAWLEKNGEDV